MIAKKIAKKKKRMHTRTPCLYTVGNDKAAEKKESESARQRESEKNSQRNTLCIKSDHSFEIIELFQLLWFPERIVIR